MIQRSAASSRIVLSVQTQRWCIRSKAQTGALLSPKKNINRVVHQEFIPQNCQQGSLLSCPRSVWGHKQHTCTNRCMCVGTLSQLIWTSYVFLVTQTHYSITMWLLARFGSLQLWIIPKMKFKLKALTAHVQNSCVFSPIDSGVQNQMPSRLPLLYKLCKRMGWAKTGVSNIRPGGQNYPGKNSNPNHSAALENVKECIDFELLMVIKYFWQLFLLIKTPILHCYPSIHPSSPRTFSVNLENLYSKCIIRGQFCNFTRI